MSNIEYNYLLFEISQRVVELNVQEQLVFMCRDLVECSADNIQSVQDVLSLFKLLEERNHLGPDCLVVMKDLLKVLREWSLFGKVKKLESKRKEYVDFLEQIIRVLDELNDLERLILICRGKIPEESTTNIHDVRSLFQVLENHSYLRIDRLEILREILIEYDKEDMLKEVDNFEKRQCDDEEFERRTAQAAAFVSCVRNASERIIGEVKVHCTFRKIGGALLVVGTGLILRKCSSLEQFIQAFTVATLPAANTLRAISEGSVCFTVQAENRSALEALWQRYRDGTLQRDLQEFLVTDEIRHLADGEEVLVSVYIDEQEFKNALEDLPIVKEQVFVSPEEKTVKMHRRNSDSSLYCKAWYGEEPKERAIQPVTNQAKYLDQERLAFVQSYLEKAEDARSMTTETSDSGMPGTHGTASELGLADTTESTPELHLKDLNEDMVEKLALRLTVDPITLNRFCQSFGLAPEKIRQTGLLMDIRKIFPGTSVRLLKDVFEALHLYDLVELLEKAKPLELRPALSMAEIGKLSNASNRPTTFFSKAVVLIIDNSTRYRATDSDPENIESFFKAIDARSEVATITVKTCVQIARSLSALKVRMAQRDGNERYQQRKLRRILERQIPQSKELLEEKVQEEQKKGKRLGTHFVGFYGDKKEGQLKNLIEKESEVKMQLEMSVKRREQWTKEVKPKIEEEIKEQEEQLHREKEKFRIDLLTTLNKWTSEEDKKTTLFAVFEVSDLRHHYRDVGFFDVMKGKCLADLTEKFTLMPDCTKLLVTSGDWKKIGEFPETLHVMYDRTDGTGRYWTGRPEIRVESFLESMLHILSKRWQTLDLISIMHEVKRDMYMHADPVTIIDSLSSRPRFPTAEKDP